jgi:superfamily II DNA or RNA helicase
MTQEMWSHQAQGFEQFWSAFDGGEKRVCITSPTGGGKTFMTTELIKEASRRNLKTVFHVNRKSLAEQTRKAFEAVDLDPGMRASGYKPEFKKPIQISMTPTESTRSLGTTPSWWVHDADIVFFDEAHGEKSARAQKLMAKYQEQNSDVVFCGLTATPLDIGHLYDRLIVAGTNSELRACGAHLPCKEFCPTMPDILKMKRKADGEYSEKDVEKKMAPSLVFGHILPHHKRLNPLLKPAIVFGPSVAGSITIADMYLNSGIPAAHIDGKSIYYGEKNSEGVPIMEDSTKIRNREELFDKVRTGEIKVLCNRYVLTEGIDLPQVYHLILATSFGSLTMFLQAGGRVLRNHDSLDHVCVARDSLVLTDRGEVKIQDVRLTDKVWDGIEFVSHDGAVCNGVREVVTWDGLTATPDHKVHTKNGWTTIKEAKADGERITSSGSGGNPVRVLDDSDPYDKEKSKSPTRCNGGLPKMQSGFLQELPQDGIEKAKRVFSLHEQIWGALSRVDLSTSSASMEKVQRPERQYVSPLRGEGDSVHVPLCLRSDLLDCFKYRRPRRQVLNSRPDRERSSLSTGEPSLGDCQSAVKQQETVHCGKFEMENIPEELPASEVRSRLCECSVRKRNDWGRDSGKVGEKAKRREGPYESKKGHKAGSIQGEIPRSEVQQVSLEQTVERRGRRPCDSPEMEEMEVWDILNAGPRHRLTVSGVLCGNCLQDHGGSVLLHGSLNDDRIWDLSDGAKKLTDKVIKDRQEGKTEEPIVCPKCGAMRLSGGVCWDCGHRHTQSGIKILQEDGILRQRKGPYIKRKAKGKSAAIKDWEGMYYPCSKSKSNKGMTWRQMLSNFKRQNPELLIFKTTDGKGRDRLAASDKSGEVSILPMHPPIGDDYLWAQKVRDVDKKRLLR